MSTSHDQFCNLETGGDGQLVTGAGRWFDRFERLRNRAVEGVMAALVSGVWLAGAETAVQVWVQRYNGPGNYSDQASAIKVDRSGNVFVTGSSYGADGWPHYATVSYSSGGVGLWTNRYAGPGGYADRAMALAVDGEGSVVVTGDSASSPDYPFNFDYATVKYSNAGVALWTNRYSGPGSNDDRGTAIGADTNGNVFVTGYSWGGTANDYVTIKYSGAGEALWTNRYAGPGNGDDRASALAVDGEGNVLVTGGSAGAGSGMDYATIKYSNGGLALWTNRYGGPGASEDRANAIGVDGNGNVFVTGYSGPSVKGDVDYVTIGYSGAGAPLWTNRYGGPGNGADTALGIAVDGSGRVFVTGESSGGTGSDCATVAYSNAGEALWTNRYDGPGSGRDTGQSIAVDGRGHVIVAGSSDGANGHGNYVTLAYSGEGAPLWTNRYVGTGNYLDTMSGAAVDGRGNVFVTGSSWGSTGVFDYVTIKYVEAGPVGLEVQRADDQLVLSWTNALFGLQCAPGLGGVFTNVSGATSPYTNPVAGEAGFFRLVLY